MDGRPGPLRWIAFTYGRSLPPSSNEWVFHDATCPTWLLRHTARFFAQLAPLIAAVLIFLPAALWIRLACVFVGVVASVLLSFGYVVESAERRVEKAGYPFGSAAKVRQQRADDNQRASAARHRARVAARQAKRAA